VVVGKCVWRGKKGKTGHQNVEKLCKYFLVSKQESNIVRGYRVDIAERRKRARRMTWVVGRGIAGTVFSVKGRERI